MRTIVNNVDELIEHMLEFGFSIDLAYHLAPALFPLYQDRAKMAEVLREAVHRWPHLDHGPDVPRTH